MKYDQAFFDMEADRRGTACEKWDGLEARTGREMNPMWVADMDFRAPKEIVDAIAKRAAHPAYGYTVQTREEISAMLAFMQRRHGIVLSEGEQILLPCVITGLRAAVLSFTKEDDRIIVQPPVYDPFYHSVRDNGRIVDECPLHYDQGRYTMDLQAVEAACQRGAKMMFLCNPHNPVGRCWTRDELTALWRVLCRYGVLLISDEIHEDFVYERGAFVPMLTVGGEDAPIIALTSASKTFNLAGLQQAVAFSRNKGLLAALQKTMHNVGVVQGNIFALVATAAAYAHGDAWLDGLLCYIKQGEQVLRQELAARLPKAILCPLEATYLAWVDVSAYGLTADEVAQRCREQGVEFNAGTRYDAHTGPHFIRINLACCHARVRLAVQGLAKAILD